MLHFKRVNSAASQTVEACKRIKKRKKDYNNNVAHTLFKIRNKCVKKLQFLRAELSRMEISRQFSFETNHVHIYIPKISSTYEPLEI